MGGSGSTRWGWHTKKTTVEECKDLDMSTLNRKGIMGWNVQWWGSCRWYNAVTNETTSTISIQVNTLDRTNPWLRLLYTFTELDESYDYKVNLETTEPYFGGWRWWFTCPLSVSGAPCGRRVRKLYLPPDGRYFGCRHCYDLTYRSCQESDKRVSALRRLNPLTLVDMAQSGEVDFLLALKAMGKRDWW